MTRKSHGAGWPLRLARLGFAWALVLTLTLPRRAWGQSVVDPWSVPVNLSHSGTATKPTIVSDSTGVVHVLWEDQFANYVYARLDGGQWSPPQPTQLHRLFGIPASAEAARDRAEPPLYTGPNPILVAGPNGYVFGLWINSRGWLYAGRVHNRDLMNVAAWDETQLLSTSAAAFAAAVDARGNLHVAFVRTVDSANSRAGVYYARSTNTGRDWLGPVLLFESPYFRNLGSGEASVSLATGGTQDAPHVFIVWDNRHRKQVFVATSPDGGTQWGAPLQVAGPTPNSGSAGPYGIRVGATETSTVIVWQNGQPGGDCTQHFQASGDGGATWTAPQSMSGALPGCAQANEFVPGQPASLPSFLYLVTDMGRQVLLSAWDASQWSDPQAQPILTTFEDPEIYTPVDYGCQRAAVSGDQVVVVGCDAGGGGDIWVTSREVASAVDWFTPLEWTQPAPVTPGDLEPTAIEQVATGDGLVHAFFSQRRSGAIYYTRLDGEQWSRLIDVLQLPAGEIGWPVAAAGPGNELILLARSASGSLYLSRANSRDAVNASAWSTPTRLPIAHDGLVGRADVGWDSAGTFYVAYSVPVYGERGIYLVQSVDHGTTWSEPLQVFDGAAAGVELVGPPALAVSAEGSLHLLWNEQSLPVEGVSEPLAMYYARYGATDQGLIPAEIVEGAPVAWREIAADGQGHLHRLWQPFDKPTTVLDQVSVDGGQSWQVGQQLAVDGATRATTVDASGRLHLVSGGVGTLSHWLWNGSRWQAEAPLRWTLGPLAEAAPDMIGAAVSADGRMVVVASVPTRTGEAADRRVLFTTRRMDLPPGQAPTPEAGTPVPLLPQDTPTASAVGTSLAPTAPVSGGLSGLGDPAPIGAGSPTTVFLMILIPVALLLLVALGTAVVRGLRVGPR